MKRTLVVLLTIVVAAPAVVAAHGAQKPSAKHAKNHDGVRGYPVVAIAYFPPQDIRVLREHYEPRFRSLPPGLAKKYERTGNLPPGWQKKIEPVPVAVERHLVVLPPEYRRGYLDGVVVVYSPRTQVVVDIVALL